MKTIFVSGASGIVGYGTLRSLRHHPQTLRLVGSSIYDDSVAPAFCDVFLKAPSTGEAGYMAWLLGTIRAHKIDLIIPGIEIDMYKWVENVPAIRDTGATALLNTPSLISLCQDKWRFYQDLVAAKMECVIPSSLDADFETLEAKFGLPFMLKPRQGFASKGIVRVDGLKTYLRHASLVGTTLMAQPIVGSDDDEYTTSAFCDGNGGLYARMTLKRKLSKDGFTEKAQVVSSIEFDSTIKSLCQHFIPLGPTNFQFRKCEDGIKLLEINPRVSSSTAIRTAFGYNESSMAVDFFLGEKTPVQPEIRPGKAVRYTEEHIFYENGIHF